MLATLDAHYQVEAALEAKLRQQKEARAMEAWTWQQMLPHVPPEIAEQILIDRKINEMDADFSFYKTLFRKDA